MPKTRIALLVLCGAVVAVLWASQCSGPRPALVGTPELEAPEQPGDPYTIRAAVRNDGPGQGDVRVLYRLRDAATGQAYQKNESLTLDRGETAGVVMEIPAPPAAYQAEVELEYPPG